MKATPFDFHPSIAYVQAVIANLPAKTGKDLAAATCYVDAQFAGKKAGLRPTFDAVITWARKELKSVKVCPCETIVPLYRDHVIAQLKATTQTRVDLGLALGDPAQLKEPKGRLLDTGGFAKKDRITTRIELKSPADFDATAQAWLREAFERDAR